SARRGRRCVGQWRQYHSLPAKEGHVLFSIKHISDRRCHAAAQTGLNIGKLFTLVRAVSNEAAVRNHLEDEIAGSRDRPASDGSSTRSAPTFFLSDRIPGDKHEVLSFRWGRSNRRRRRTRLAEASTQDSRISFSRLVG